MEPKFILVQTLSGISVGMVIFLIAVGLSLIFGALRVLNLAHGSLYMIGAYLSFWVASLMPDSDYSFWWTLLLAPLGAALFGGLLEVLLIRRIYQREHVDQFLLTFGLILVIGDLVKILWGVEFNMVQGPSELSGGLEIMGTRFPVYNLFLIGCGIVIYLALSLLMNFTSLGRTVRAMTYERNMVSALGINVPMTYTLVFMLGCWLAGVGGTLIAPIQAVRPGMDIDILIECFIVVVVGGLGSLSGAFVGALLFGILNAFGILLAPRLAIAFGFMLMIVVLVIRPWGLMGKPE